MLESEVPAGVAQLVRARGSYPRCPGFKSLHRHQFSLTTTTEAHEGELQTFPDCMSLESRVLRTIRRHDLLPRGARVLVALSGGRDSVALLHILRALERRGELVVAGAAHFNHQLRGAEADADEAFCRDLAASSGVRFVAGRADV